jgi:hypothetical protein
MHDVFVSCSGNDGPRIRTLIHALAKRGLSVWWDRTVLVGEDYWEVVSDRLENARCVLVIWSEDSIRSERVKMEVAAGQHRGQLVSVKIDDVVPPTELPCTIDLVGWNGETAAEGFRQLCVGIDNVLAAHTSHPPAVSRPDRRMMPAVPNGTESSGFAVFISAKNEDYTHARRVYDFLRENGVRAFFSEISLPELGNMSYRKEIDRALDQAMHMIVVTSSDANVSSGWVEHEWNVFLNDKLGGRKSGNLVTMTAGTVPHEKLPPSLRSYQVIPLDEAGPEERCASSAAVRARRHRNRHTSPTARRGRSDPLLHDRRDEGGAGMRSS